MATSIGRELDALATREGVIYPATVVAWAQDNPQSALHGAFEWDIAKAAQAHWMWQARQLIAIHVTTEQGERRTIALSADRPAGGYRYTGHVLSNAELRREAESDAVKELERWRDKYQFLGDSFRPVFRAITRAADQFFDHGGKRAA